MKRTLLWLANMPFGCPVAERIQIAAAFGYSELSLAPADFDAVGSDKRAAGDLRRAAEEAGVRLSVMDAVTDWYPYDRSREYRAQPRGAREVFAAAEAFGCDHVCAIPVFPSDLDIAGFAEAFAQLCDQAAEHGMVVQLEFTPLPPGRGLRYGWDVVRLADRPNGGIVFDSWHFFRSDPDFALLEGIPGQRITGVRINDGAEELRESLIKDTYFSRLNPGEGSFDLKRLIGVLDRIGGLNGLGPEVLSREQHALPPMEAVGRATEALDRLLSDVVGPEPSGAAGARQTSG